MYSTGILLIVRDSRDDLAAFVLKFGQDHLDNSQALLFGVYMVAVEVVIAAILLYVARQVSKRRDTICAKNDKVDG